MANLFFRAGYIEVWGRGMSIIFNECNKYKIPQPFFTENSGGFFIEFFKDVGKDVGKDVRKDVRKDVGKDLSDTEKNVYTIIKRNQKITIPQIATEIELSQRTIERCISKLKALQLITRIGGKKDGSWKINK